MSGAPSPASHRHDDTSLSMPERSQQTSSSTSDATGSAISKAVAMTSRALEQGEDAVFDSAHASKAHAPSTPSSATTSFRRGARLRRSLTRLFSRGSMRATSPRVNERSFPTTLSSNPPQPTRRQESRHAKTPHPESTCDDDTTALQRRQLSGSWRRRFSWSSLRRRQSLRRGDSQRHSSSQQGQGARQPQEQTPDERGLQAKPSPATAQSTHAVPQQRQEQQQQRQRGARPTASPQQHGSDATARAPLHGTTLFDPPPARRELPPLPSRGGMAGISSLLLESPSGTAAPAPVTRTASSTRDSGLSGDPDAHGEERESEARPSARARAVASSRNHKDATHAAAVAKISVTRNSLKGSDKEGDDGHREAGGGLGETRPTLSRADEDGGDSRQTESRRASPRGAQEAWRDTQRTPGSDDDGYSTASLASSNISTTRTRRGLGPLHLAAVEGNATALRRLLTRASVHVDTADADGVTPLILAVLSRRFKTARVLLDHGANINHRDNHGRTAVHWVTYNGLCRALRWLLQHGADWTVKDGANRSSLHWAADQRDYRCLALLLSSLSSSAIMTRRRISSSLLSRSSRSESASSSSSSSFLPWASRLLRPRSSASISPRRSATPVTATSTRATAAITGTATTSSSGGTAAEAEPLPSAVATTSDPAEAQAKRFSELLDAVDCQVMTALAWACHHGHLQHIKLLLKHGARTDIPNAQGRVCMHHVVQLPSPGCAQQLMQSARNDIFVRDHDGRTPLHLACMHGSVKMIRLLFQGARAALASTSGAMQDLHGIVDLHAFCQARDSQGRTPLHFAAVMGHTEACATLLSLGHAPDVYDNSNHMPVYYARVKGHSETVEYLAAAVVRAHEAEQQQALLSIGMGDAAADEATTALPSDYAVF